MTLSVRRSSRRWFAAFDCQLPPPTSPTTSRSSAKGLALDSIDVLELVLELERTFGASITDEETGKQVLRTVNTIAEFIQANGGPRRP